MRRVHYTEYGGPEVLTLEDAPVPEPGAGQVRIRAEAIGANFVDTRFRRGPSSGALFARPLPGSPGGDVVGVVDAVGPDVDEGLRGRRVAALVAEGAFADYSVADAAWLVPVPDELDDGAASMLPTSAPVALGLLRTGRLAPGETVLVHAAAGGIGHLIVQLARLLGAGSVIATASSPAKLDFAREWGADVAIDHTDPAWFEKVTPGVDLVLDANGGDVLRRSLELLAPTGRAVVYGAAGGELVEIPVTSLFPLRSVLAYSILGRRAAAPDVVRDELAELAGMLADGRLRTHVHARLPLAEAVEAHRILDARAQHGRVLLTL
ncbi:quinone oxidoreductase family protein [Cryptosporangium phraense]|uniref:Zinc-binding dehydrogenase n=1 Tax=Cryptosporangium phraense TaxID=2593070 RepID=A0A545AWX0_9ACTN|nr:zinc-binding dehydrogenase [Cryptosporangium phraense]TQS45827.1 zinc-binding dehydrogenase [Cryptosporangium phraense]